MTDADVVALQQELAESLGRSLAVQPAGSSRVVVVPNAAALVSKLHDERDALALKLAAAEAIIAELLRLEEAVDKTSPTYENFEQWNDGWDALLASARAFVEGT